jgi:hypothetical protein
MQTTHQEIVEYWESHQNESGLAIDWAEAKQLCWRCAQKRSLQRCHIVPRALGGSEEPGNLVLLCAQCHSEAPNVADPAFMWFWLRAHAVPFCGTYWYGRGLREYEFVFGEKLEVSLADVEDFMPKFQTALEQHIRLTSTHWGQGKMNPATMAWLLRQVVLDVKNME